MLANKAKTEVLEHKNSIFSSHIYPNQLNQRHIAYIHVAQGLKQWTKLSIMGEQ